LPQYSIKYAATFPCETSFFIIIAFSNGSFLFECSGLPERAFSVPAGLYSKIKPLFLHPNMARILAIDFGTKRTGIAVTDELQLIASGLTTVETPKLLNFLKDYFLAENVSLVLVGQPLQKDGTPSDVEEEIQKFLEIFEKNFQEMPVKRVDERYTSKMAFQTMIDSGLSKKKRRNKALIDEISATIILQEYLYND